MSILINSDILQVQRHLADISERIDVMTYGYGPKATELVVWGRAARVICGVFTDEDLRKIQAWATRLGIYRWKWRGEVRSLRGSHAKIFIGHFSNGKGQAVVSSSNLGTEGNTEFGYHITRASEYKSLSKEFETLWACSQLVKPLDTESVVKNLSSSVFEDRRESTVPDLPTVTTRKPA